MIAEIIMEIKIKLKDRDKNHVENNNDMKVTALQGCQHLYKYDILSTG